MPRIQRLLIALAFILSAAGLMIEPAAARRAVPLAEPGFSVDAGSGLLMDPESGAVLFAKNEDKRLPPASLTKILSLLLVMEALADGRAHLDEPVTATAHAAGIGGSQVYLREGERFTLEQMLIAVAVESANDATTALAEHLYSTEDDFVRIMNARARGLGAKNSHFANSHGLPSADHYSSAYDMALFARELITRHPDILKYTSIWTYTFRPGVTELRNTNELIRDYRGADGLKTGSTDEAGWCLVGTAKRGQMRLLSVVMQTASNAARLRETKRLLDYGFRNFERKIIARKGEALGSVAVPEARPARIELSAKRDLAVVAPRGRIRFIQSRLVPRPGVRAPVAKGDPLAYLEITEGGRILAREPIKAPEDIKRAGFLIRAWRALLKWLSGLFA